MKIPFREIFPPLSVFYILVAYILASLIWWSMLHMRKNKSEFENKATIMRLMAERQGRHPEDVIHSVEYRDLEKKMHRQNQMIYGEGIIFLLILFVGAYQVHSGLRKEIALNRQQRNFLLSITHELKSPLASIKLTLQTLIQRQLSPDRSKGLLNNSLQDTERLSTLVDNLLMAAKLESQSVQYLPEEQSLNGIVEEVFFHLKNRGNLARQIELELEEDLGISGDRLALVTIVSNLVENAIKYSGEGDIVGAQAFRSAKKLILRVYDTGIGIEAAEKDKVFEKFYRVGNEDTRRTKGTGLGLYLVRQLVRLHKGTINVSDNVPKGTVFTLEFPYREFAEASSPMLTKKSKA